MNVMVPMLADYVLRQVIAEEFQGEAHEVSCARAGEGFVLRSGDACVHCDNEEYTHLDVHGQRRYAAEAVTAVLDKLHEMGLRYA